MSRPPVEIGPWLASVSDISLCNILKSSRHVRGGGDKCSEQDRLIVGTRMLKKLKKIKDSKLNLLAFLSGLSICLRQPRQFLPHHQRVDHHPDAGQRDWT